MLVEMTKTTKGANDGLHVRKYLKGQTYELSESLGSTFLSMEVAVLTTKSMGGAPMNKDATEASEDESKGSSDTGQGDGGAESEEPSKGKPEATEKKAQKKRGRKKKEQKY